MTRIQQAETAIITTAVSLLLVIVAFRYYERRPPYLSIPETVVDHVDRRPHEARDTLVLIEKIRPHLPRGAEVTCFRPHAGEQQYDGPIFLTAVGLLPHNEVLPPFTAETKLPREELIEYVIAVREPFLHPWYTPVVSYPEGTLYKVWR